MARIKLSALISEISGKVGGTVFQKNKNGWSMKNKSVGTKKLSPRSQNIKSINLRISTAWANLSQANRNLYAQFVSFIRISQVKNTSNYISAYEYFRKNNFYRLFYSISILETPVFSVLTFQSLTADLSLSMGSLYIDLDRYLDSGIEFLIISLTKPLNSGAYNNKSLYKMLPIVTTSSIQLDITAEYLAIFHVLPVIGQKIFFNYSNANLLNGRTSAFKQSSVVFS